MPAARSQFKPSPLAGPLVLLRGFVVWLGLVLMAVANGFLRQEQLIPRFGVLRGGQLSALILASGIIFVAYFTIDWIEVHTRREAWILGASWVILVLAFEFGLGLARGMSWAMMLEDYRFWRGRLWVIVLLATLVAPYVATRLHRVF